jgi:Mce-associated membrane protein
MTGRDQTAAGGSRGRDALGAVNLRLLVAVLTGVLALGFVTVAGLRIVHPESLNHDRAEVARAADREDEVTAAARKVTLAFLDVDYRDMDPRVQKVLDLSTGTFKKQYRDTSVNLTAAARQGRAVSSGSIKYIGISDQDADSAVVFVAADSTVTNLAMQQAKAKGQKVDDKRYYRFQLNLTRVGGRWLLNDLQFVS